MRQCLFCARGANSREDAWPRWITDQFKCDRPIQLDAERQGIPLKPWHVYQPELVVRAVCEHCNNGWMSQLENRAKPILQPLLEGRRCGLDIADQTTIALWTLKTAMVLEGLDPAERRVYTQVEREHLRALSAIPVRTSVWICKAVDPSYFMSTKNRHLAHQDVASPSGASITLAFSHVVLQAFTIRVPANVGPATRVTVDVRRGPWEITTVRVWPAQTSTVSWPPVMGLNGEAGLDSLAERFNTSAQDKDTLDSMAV